MSVVKDFVSVIKSADKKSTKPYDTQATVTRVEGDTAWVHIPGGVDETPIKMTVSAKAGDVVQVRVSGGTAWLTGNATAPPTDDTQAIKATETAVKAVNDAGKAQETANAAEAIVKAVSQHFWNDTNGAHVSTEAGNPAGSQNTIWNTLGMLFRAGVNNILAIITGNDPGMDVYDGQGNDNENVVASYRGSGIRIGKDPTSETSAAYFDTTGMKVKTRYNYSPFSVYTLAGIGSTNGEVRQETTNSFDTDWTYVLDFVPWADTEIVIKNYNNTICTFVSGTAGTESKAYGTFSYDGLQTITYTHVAGSGMAGSPTFIYRLYNTGKPILYVGDIRTDVARAGYTATIGTNLIASTENQLISGVHNDNQSNHAFEIGNGADDRNRSNAFTVDWDGNVEAAGTIKSTKTTSAVTLSGCTANRNVCSSTGSVATINVGTIKLNAALASGSSVVIGTVPSGYRPPDIVGALCFNGDTTLCGKVYVRITTAGELRMYNYSGSQIAANATAGSFLVTYCL